MKKILKSVLSIATVAMTLASCSKEVAQDVKPEGKVVYFGTEVNDLTKASLTPNDGDTSFEAAWESGDALKISCLSGGNFDATWNGTAFASTNASSYFGVEHNFVAAYPACDSYGKIGFGAERTQNGNSYNGDYDVMLSEKEAMTLVEGQTFKFNMYRQTAIAYFHLTSTLPEDEKVVSAKLSVNEENTLVGGFTFNNGTLTPSKSGNSITLTFENAPSIKDLKLWFNVFPGTYTGLKLVVETEGHTLTLNNTNEVTYDQGKLYKVAGDATEKYIANEATMSAGSNADAATVNEKAAIKVGTSKNDGNMTIKVGAGATSLTFYAAAWKGSSNKTLSISPSANVYSSSVTLIADDGIANNSPFTLVQGAETFKHTIRLKNITKETTFTLSSNVRFAVWGAMYSKGKYPGPKEYIVTVDDNIENGEVTASLESAEAGTLITLTPKPADGYEFNAWNVTNSATSASIAVTNNSFTMPDADVNVSATFKKIPDEKTAVEIDFSKKSYGNGDSVTSADIDENITIELNNSKYYTTGSAVRVYGGGYFTVKNKTGKTKTITSISLTYGSGDGSNSISVDSGTFTSPTWTGEATSVKFTISGSTGHRRIQKISVTYIK